MGAAEDIEKDRLQPGLGDQFLPFSYSTGPHVARVALSLNIVEEPVTLRIIRNNAVDDHGLPFPVQNTVYLFKKRRQRRKVVGSDTTGQEPDGAVTEGYIIC